MKKDNTTETEQINEQINPENFTDEKVSFLLYESATSRLHAIIRQLMAVIVILIVLLFGSNIAWIIYEARYTDVVTTTEIEQEVNAETGDAFAFGAGGDLSYGDSKAEDNENN